METVSGNMYITLQNKDEYKNMARLESTRKLYAPQWKQLNIFTQSVQLNIGPSKVCAVLTKTP